MKTPLALCGALSLLSPCSGTDRPESGTERRMFYAIDRSDTIRTCQKFIIDKNKFMLDRTDRAPYDYHISDFRTEGDSVIELHLDQVINTKEYERGHIVLYEGEIPAWTETLLRRKPHTFIWVRKDDRDFGYPYNLIDSLDVRKSGYPVDTVNHWLND